VHGRNPLSIQKIVPLPPPKEGILSSPAVAAVSPPGAQKCTIDEYTSFQMAIRLKAPVSPAALAAYLQLP
jgi:hypothetical protein